MLLAVPQSASFRLPVSYSGNLLFLSVPLIVLRTFYYCVKSKLWWIKKKRPFRKNFRFKLFRHPRFIISSSPPHWRILLIHLVSVDSIDKNTKIFRSAPNYITTYTYWYPCLVGQSDSQSLSDYSDWLAELEKGRMGSNSRSNSIATNGPETDQTRARSSARWLWLKGNTIGRSSMFALARFDNCTWSRLFGNSHVLPPDRPYTGWTKMVAETNWDSGGGTLAIPVEYLLSELGSTMT